MSSSRVSAIQMNSGSDYEANLKRAESLIQEAAEAGAQLVALPENFACIAGSAAAYQALSEPEPYAALQNFLSTQAQKTGVWLLAGTIPVRDTSSDKIASVSILYSAAGEEVARYQKIHLFDINLPEKNVKYQESSIFAAGNHTCITETPVGRLGLAVCYDVRFPEMFRSMSAEGIDLFVLPSAFTHYTGAAHWHTLLKARAIENQACLIAPAQTGAYDNGRRQSYGHSMIVNAWGQVLAELETGEGVITASIDLDQQNRLRQNFPCLQHRVL